MHDLMNGGHSTGLVEQDRASIGQFSSHAAGAWLVRSSHDQDRHRHGRHPGIGRHSALRIAERGAGVILTYNSNLDGA